MTSTSDTEIKPVHVVLPSHHDSAETAYVVDDYPYGRLRCKRRTWVETAARGPKKGQQRFVWQTTNPKKPGEVWNKPHGETYSHLVIMYLDHQQRMEWAGINTWGPTPEEHHRYALMGILDKLDEQQATLYAALLSISRDHSMSYGQRWTEFEQKVSALAELIRSGATPDIVNGSWKTPRGQLHYLFDAPEVYLTIARQRTQAD